MNNLEQRVLATALMLLKKNGKTTTLDIKNECRALFPDKFYQSDISDIMDQLGNTNIPNLTYSDNGTYREYFIEDPQSTAAPLEIYLSKKEMIKVLRDNVGKFFGITFIKKDGSKRTLNAHMSDKYFINDLGYLNIITNRNEYKQVDPKNILEISINGNTYVAK